MTDTPKPLSIATPTFGKGRYLAICLDSIRAQTVEVDCCVCDGGTDFDFDDPKWSFVKRRSLHPDPGIVGCWNAAADLTDSPYLAFLADDNALETRFAEEMIGFLKAHPECDAVFCNQAVIDSAGNLDAEETARIAAQYGRDNLPLGTVPAQQNAFLFEKNAIPLEACVLRREAWRKYGPFRASAHGALDLDLFTRMLVGGATFGFVPQALMQFRFHDEAYTARRREEHLRGMVWSMQSIHAGDAALEAAIRRRETELLGHLLRGMKRAEMMAAARGMMKSGLGRKTLVRALVARGLGRGI